MGVVAPFVGRAPHLACRAMDRPADGDALETFLVERYWPGVDLAMLRDALPRLEAAARAMTAEGRVVEHVGSILMPVDQVVFSLIAAVDESAVHQLNARLDLPADRIAAAIALLRPDPPTAAGPDLPSTPSEPSPIPGQEEP